jgi:hypothetical protein
MLTFIRISRDITAPIPPHFKDYSLKFEDDDLSIFEKVLECIPRNDIVYSEPLYCYSNRSVFYLTRWGGYGQYVLAALMLTLKEFLSSYIAYSDKLLCLTFQPKLKLMNTIDLITVGRSIESSSFGSKRDQYHILVRLPHVPMAKANTSTIISGNNDLSDIEKLKLLIGNLPTELRESILHNGTSNTPFPCSANSWKCNRYFHTQKGCQSRSRIIYESMMLIFPISARKRRNKFGTRFTEIYLVLTAKPRNGHQLRDCHLDENSGYCTFNAKDYLVMDKNHYQGNTLNMNDKIFNDLKILSSDYSYIDCNSTRCFTEIENRFYDSNQQFHDIQLNCEHSKEFIPKMSNVEPHYLLFD